MKLSLSNNTRVEQSAKNGLTWCQILGQIAFTFFGCLAAPSFGTKSGTRNRNKKLYPHCLGTSFCSYFGYRFGTQIGNPTAFQKRR